MSAALDRANSWLEITATVNRPTPAVMNAAP
jgi:hypothetical protein